MNDVHGPGGVASESLIVAFRRAIQEELAAQNSQSLPGSIAVPWGRWMYTTGESHVYQVRTSEALKEPPDTQVQITLQEQVYPGTLVAARGLMAQVAFESYLGEEIFRGHLGLYAANLLRKLEETLERFEREAPGFNHSLAEYLFSPVADDAPTQGVPSTSGDLSTAMLMKAAEKNRRLFVWGPAGTGKTHALASLGSHFIEQGESVLVAGNTHISVNNGLARLVQRLQNEALLVGKETDAFIPGGILRYGLLEGDHGGLEFQFSKASPDRWMRDHYPELWERRLALALASKDAKDRWQEWRRNRRQQTKQAQGFQRSLMEIESDFQEINRRWRSALQEAVGKVQVVACTLAQIYLTPNLWQRNFDTVLIDEASMASPPVLFLAAGLARKRVVVIGDFRQLAPIAFGRSETSREWLCRDIFEITGVNKWQQQAKGPHDEIHVLHKQRRMRPGISALSSAAFYHGQIVDDLRVVKEESTYDYPAVVLYDTGGAKPWCTRRARGEGHSRVNLYHASVAVQIAERTLLKIGSDLQHGIGIITPYREQAKLIQHMLEDRNVDEFVQVATVHQFQGEERDVIIWDTVDTFGFPVSQLLQGELGSAAARVINVALTRARKHLAIIADQNFLLRHLIPQASLRHILEHLQREEIPQVDARKLIPANPDFQKLFTGDLGVAKKTVVVSAPLLFGKLSEVVSLRLEILRQQGVKILIDTLSPHLQRKVLRDHYQGPPDFLGMPGVTTICHDFPEWSHFVHPHLVLIDDRICWFAPFNFLEFEDENDRENCFRISGKHAIEDLNVFFGISLLKQAPDFHLACPICEGNMVLMWNRRKFRSQGDFFATCSEGCGYKRPLLRSEKEAGKAVEFFHQPTTRSQLNQRTLPGFAADVKPGSGVVGAGEKIGRTAPKEKVLDKCGDCGSPTTLRFNPNRYLFVGCTQWPQCSFTRPYQEDCSACGAKLVIRRSKNGIFLGCVQFPKCRHTKDLPEEILKTGT